MQSCSDVISYYSNTCVVIHISNSNHSEYSFMAGNLNTVFIDSIACLSNLLRILLKI